MPVENIVLVGGMKSIAGASAPDLALGGFLYVQHLDEALASPGAGFAPLSVLLRKWLLAFVLAIIGAVIAYFWLDRPIAFFAHDHLAKYRIFAALTRIHEVFAPLSAL